MRLSVDHLAEAARRQKYRFFFHMADGVGRSKKKEERSTTSFRRVMFFITVLSCLMQWIFIIWYVVRHILGLLSNVFKKILGLLWNVFKKIAKEMSPVGCAYCNRSILPNRVVCERCESIGLEDPYLDSDSDSDPCSHPFSHAF